MKSQLSAQNENLQKLLDSQKEEITKMQEVAKTEFQNLANKIRKTVGIILIIFSFFIFLQSYKKFNQFDKRLEEAESKEILYQNAK